MPDLGTSRTELVILGFKVALTKTVAERWLEPHFGSAGVRPTVHCKAGTQSIRLVFETAMATDAFYKLFKNGLVFNVASSSLGVEPHTVHVKRPRNEQERADGKLMSHMYKQAEEFLTGLGMWDDFKLSTDSKARRLCVIEQQSGLARPIFAFKGDPLDGKFEVLNLVPRCSQERAEQMATAATAALRAAQEG